MLYANEWDEEPADTIDGLISQLSNIAPRLESPVLVLDQFEDVFKVTTNRHKLWDRLAEAVNVSNSRVHLLICMREEWLGAWQEVNDYVPDAFSSLARLAPLTEEDLKKAIQLPAREEGSISFSDDLTKRLIVDLRRRSAYAKGTHIEPYLLQLVCRRLWNEAHFSNKSELDEQFYRLLGSADHIIREFVWNELGSAGQETTIIRDSAKPHPSFAANDRVLWVGITRHLIAAHGVKASVSPVSLAKQLVITDLGIAGPAVVANEIGMRDEVFFEMLPEKRSDPPDSVMNWITSVLDKACEAGFMKRHKQGQLYELAHDSLVDIFTVFKIEFESWIWKKCVKSSITGIVLILLLMSAVLIVDKTDSEGILGWAEEIGGVTLVLIVVLIFIILILMAWYFFVEVIRYFLKKMLLLPIVRFLCTGRLEMPGLSNKDRLDI